MMDLRTSGVLLSSPSPREGEGWGGGYAARESTPPSRLPSLTLRQPTSPSRGEVKERVGRGEERSAR